MRVKQRLARVLPVFVLAVPLAGCGGGGGGMMGIVPDSSTPSHIANLLAFGSTTRPLPPAPGKITDADVSCPQIEVLDGTSSLRVFAGGQANTDVRYQFSLGDVARECSVSGTQLSIKVGVEGRVIIGPKGSPGSFTAPIRIAIRRDGDHTAAASKFFKTSVTVPAGALEAPFTLIADPIVVPLINAKADEDYTVLVGFDEAGGVDKVVRRKRPHKS